MEKTEKIAAPVGKLFVLEGPDDVGKTTLATRLAQYLSDIGRPARLLSFPGREPGTMSELVYRLYHNSLDFGVSSVTPVAMQILVTAAHVDVIEGRVKPLLKDGVDVVLDRYWWSTWVYAKVEGVPEQIRDMLIQLEMLSWEDITPETVFLVSRTEPLLQQPSNTRWKGIVALYVELSEDQKRTVQVQVVSNDGTLSEAFEVMVSTLNIPGSQVSDDS